MASYSRSRVSATCSLVGNRLPSCQPPFWMRYSCAQAVLGAEDGEAGPLEGVAVPDGDVLGPLEEVVPLRRDLLRACTSARPAAPRCSRATPPKVPLGRPKYSPCAWPGGSLYRSATLAPISSRTSMTDGGIGTSALFFQSVSSNVSSIAVRSGALLAALAASSFCWICASGHELDLDRDARVLGLELRHRLLLGHVVDAAAVGEPGGQLDVAGLAGSLGGRGRPPAGLSAASPGGLARRPALASPAALEHAASSGTPASSQPPARWCGETRVALFVARPGIAFLPYSPSSAGGPDRRCRRTRRVAARPLERAGTTSPSASRRLS